MKKIAVGLFFVMSLCLATVLLLLYGCSKPPGKPNVILISIDTLRADHLGCYGYEYERDTSPNIDEFADGAVLFTEAFSPTCWTAPAHMSMFTGLYPSVHKVNDYPISAKLNEDIKTLTQYLKDDGYSTHGLYYGHYLAPEFGFDRGFDSYVQQDFIANSTPDALALLEKIGNDTEPFFLFLHAGDVHAPYMDLNEFTKKTPEERDMFDPDYKGAIVTGSEEETLELAKRLWKALDKGTFDSEKGIFRDIYHLQALYDGAIKHTDKYLGRFFQALKEEGLYDNTLIIFTSDHGEEFGEHNNFGHNQLHRELIHVPLIVKLAASSEDTLGLKAARRIKQRVMLMDIMPTVLDLLGLQAARPHQGRSLVPLMKGEGYGERVVYGESEMPSGAYETHRSVLDSEYHFLRDQIPVKPDKSPSSYRLYDSVDDKRETFNLLKEKRGEKAELIADYDALLGKWQKEMSEFRPRITKDTGEKPPAKMSDEQVQWLKSLGYVQ